MIKALVFGLGLVLSTAVASAQPRPAQPKPAQTPAPAPATPVAPQAPDSGSAARPPAGTTAPGQPAPMKTDEKAGPNEVLQSAPGSYQAASKVNQDCALRAFHDGNDLLNNALFPQSVARYREALRCWDHPAVHYNLALALINLDQPIEVFEHLNAAIQYGPSPIGQDKYDHAKEYLKLVAGQLADIEVSCDKPGARVAVDGKEVFVAPGHYRAKVRVGKHTFFGEKAGYNTRITAPFIGPGETFRIELKLYTVEELTRYQRRWSQAWLPYAVLGAGAAFGLAGGAFDLSARASYKDYDDAVAKCTAPCLATTPGIADKRSDGDTKRTIAYVGYGIAGAAIATGAVLAWLNRSRPYQVRPEDVEDAHAAPAPAVSVAPLVSPELTGAMVLGHF